MFLFLSWGKSEESPGISLPGSLVNWPMIQTGEMQRVRRAGRGWPHHVEPQISEVLQTHSLQFPLSQSCAQCWVWSYTGGKKEKKKKKHSRLPWNGTRKDELGFCWVEKKGLGKESQVESVQSVTPVKNREQLFQVTGKSTITGEFCPFIHSFI